MVFLLFVSLLILFSSVFVSAKSLELNPIKKNLLKGNVSFKDDAFIIEYNKDLIVLKPCAFHNKQKIVLKHNTNNIKLSPFIEKKQLKSKEYYEFGLNITLPSSYKGVEKLCFEIENNTFPYYWEQDSLLMNHIKINFSDLISLGYKVKLDKNLILLEGSNIDKKTFFNLDPTVTFYTQEINVIDSAPLGDNLFVISFCDQTNNKVVWKVYYANGTLYNENTSVDSIGPCYNNALDVVAVNNHTFAMSYYDRNSAQVEGRVFDINGTLISDFIVDNDASGGSAPDTSSITRLDNDSILIAWFDTNGCIYKFKIYNINGTEEQGETIIYDSSYCFAWPISISSFDNQTFAAIVCNNYDPQVFIEYINGSVIYNSGDLGRCSRAIDTKTLDNNKVIVTWYDDGTEDFRFRSYYKNGTPISSWTGASVYNDNDVYKVELASFDDEKFVVAWSGGPSSGSPDNYYYSIYYYNGTAINTSILVSSYDSTVSYPSISVLSKESNCDLELCGDSFIISYIYSTSNATWKSYTFTGNEWNGTCPLFTTQASFSPSSNVYYNDTPILGYCNVSKEEGGDLTYYYKLYKNDELINSGSYENISSGTKLNVVNVTQANSSDVFELECWGSDGVYESSKDTASITILNYPPTTPILISPLNDSYTADLTPTFEWNTSDPEGNPITNHLQVSDASDFSNLVINVTTSDSSYTPSSSLSDYTTYYWRVWACDDDCSSYSQTWLFHTDTSVPEITINLSPSSPIPYNHSGFNVTIDWNATSSAGIDTKYCNITYANGSFIQQNTTSPIILNTWDLGEYKVVCWANATTGRSNQSVVYFNITDQTPPVFLNESLSDSPYYVDEVLAIFANFTDYESGIDSVVLTIEDPNGILYEDLSMTYSDIYLQYVKSFTPNVIGVWKVLYYNVTDNAGNKLNKNSSLNFTVTSAPSSGGGGGGGTRETIINQTINIPAEEVCNNNGICEAERGENYWNCNTDCKFDISYLTCDDPTLPCLWKTNWFAVFLLGVIMLSLVFLYGTPKTNKRRRRYARY